MSNARLLGAAFTATVAALTALVAAPPASPAHADGTDEAISVIGTFEGTTFRLADGWGEAHACVSDDGATARCYRTEAEMDAAEGNEVAGRFDVQPLSDCSGSGLRLYASTSYGGDVLQLKLRWTVLNLATYGFNNVTSSYKVGACSSTLFDTTSGGTVYPGDTSAGVWASTMATNWDNRVGSAYLS